MVRPLTPGKFNLVGCPGCPKQFRAYGSKPQTFCSLACRSSHLRAGQACAACGIALTTPKSWRRKFCSKKCSEISMRLDPGRGLRNEAVSTYRRHAKERGLDWLLTDAQADALFAGDCHWCGAPPSNKRARARANGEFVYNGIDRVVNDGHYTVSNCVSCCFDCNFMKRDMSVADFISKAAAIARRWA